MDQQFLDLAEALELRPTVLQKHLALPLAPPVAGVLDTWPCHSSHRILLSICDGFCLFGKDSWNSFRILGSEELPVPDPLDYAGNRSRELGIVPIFGGIPHCASVRADDGAVVASDWEFEGDEGWLSVIAPSIAIYVASVIAVREAYGYDEDGMPSDWWYPYSAHGERFDLEP